MELHTETSEKIKDMLRTGGEPYLLYAKEYIETLEKKYADKENALIQAHNDIIYWSNRAKQAEKERDLAIARLKQAADDNGGCWGCKWLDEETDECTNPEGRLICSAKTNNMWEWKGLEK